VLVLERTLFSVLSLPLDSFCDGTWQVFSESLSKPDGHHAEWEGAGGLWGGEFEWAAYGDGRRGVSGWSSPRGRGGGSTPKPQARLQ